MATGYGTAPGAGPYAEGLSQAAAESGLLGKAGKTLGGKGNMLKAAGPGLLAWLLLQGGSDMLTKHADIGLAREAAGMQGELTTPESIYQQAALPGAMAGAQQAKQALLAQLSGGIIGPTLASGERMIGG